MHAYQIAGRTKSLNLDSHRIRWHRWATVEWTGPTILKRLASTRTIARDTDALRRGVTGYFVWAGPTRPGTPPRAPAPTAPLPAPSVVL